MFSLSSLLRLKCGLIVALLLAGLAAASSTQTKDHPFLQPVTVSIRGAYRIDSDGSVVPLQRGAGTASQNLLHQSALAFFSQNDLPSLDVEVVPLRDTAAVGEEVAARLFTDMERQFESLRTTLYSASSPNGQENATVPTTFVGQVKRPNFFLVRSLNHTNMVQNSTERYIVADMYFNIVVGFLPSAVLAAHGANSLAATQALLKSNLGVDAMPQIDNSNTLVDFVCAAVREDMRPAHGAAGSAMASLTRAQDHWMSHALKTSHTKRSDSARFSVVARDENNMHATAIEHYARLTLESFRLASHSTMRNLTYLTYTTNLWNLDRVDERSASTLNGQYSAVPTSSSDDPAAPYIYIVDSGVFVQHDEFLRVPGNRSSGSRASILFDALPAQKPHWCDGHGSHVAGIAAGNKVGANKAARVFSVRTLDCSGQGGFDVIVAGINSIIDHCPRDRTIVINLSLSAPGSSSSLLTSLYNARVACDAVIIVAAGNYGNTPNVSPLACDLTPANSQDATTVGATELVSSNIDGMAIFSSYGSCVDILAPGKDIISVSTDAIDAYKVLSGTSMAAPLVAGIASLHAALQVPGVPHKAYHQEIRQRLLADATPDVVSTGMRPSTVNLMAYVAPTVLVAS